MKIQTISTYTVKSKTAYSIGGSSSVGERLPNSNYYRLKSHPQLYSDFSEALIVKVETDTGLVGWGETQAPIGPEVARTIIEKILGPALLGRSPLDTNLRFTEMYETMRVRGHWSSYQIDALAGLDIALWDLRGKAAGLPVSQLLGGRYRETLPCYVSGLRRKTREERVEEALAYKEAGISGLKLFLGYGIELDTADIALFRDTIGSRMNLMVDTLWRCGYSDAVKLGRVCERFGVDFFEAPLAPEDIRGHARLARELDVAIAVGECLRTRFEFIDWLNADALDLCQPDVMRNGITESYKIAVLAESMNKPVAFHTGCVTAIGMAATFHVAAACPNFHIQEFQPLMFETFNPWLVNPLELRNGELVVPTGPGLGIDLNPETFMRDVVDTSRISLD